MTRYVLATLALIAVAAGTTWFVCYRIGTDSSINAALEKGDALEWLRSDFHLNDTQFAAVKRLHESYATVCEEHCQAIQEAARQRDVMRAQASADPAALAGAEKKVQELRMICETAIAAHVREVATHMAPEQGRRYLALVLPKIKDFDHQGAANVRVGHH